MTMSGGCIIVYYIVVLMIPHTIISFFFFPLSFLFLFVLAFALPCASLPLRPVHPFVSSSLLLLLIFYSSVGLVNINYSN